LRATTRGCPHGSRKTRTAPTFNKLWRLSLSEVFLGGAPHRLAFYPSARRLHGAAESRRLEEYGQPDSSRSAEISLSICYIYVFGERMVLK